MQQAFDPQTLLRTFFRRSFLLTLFLAVVLALGLPYLRYRNNIADFKLGSLDMVNSFLARELDFDLKDLRQTGREGLMARIAVFMEYSDLVEFRIWDAEAVVAYSFMEPGIIGQRFSDDHELLETLRTGKPKLSIEAPWKMEQRGLAGHGTLLEMYVPVRHAGRVVGAVELYRRAPRLGLLDPGNLLYGAAALILPILLHVFFFGQFKAAARELVLSGVRLRGAYDALSRASFDSIRSLAKALEMRDTETEGHCERVVALSVAIGRRMGISPEEMSRLVVGAYLHDVGKIGVADAILLKPGPLTTQERSLMERHVDKGGDIINEVAFLRLGEDVVLHHHERWDGTGYPRGLAGEAIPVTARIFALVDVFDALMSRRPYKEPMGFEESAEILRQSSGTHFDPAVVRAFFEITPPELAAIQEEILRQGVHALVRQATDRLIANGSAQDQA